MDLNAITDQQLDQLRVDVLTEQERRRRLASIPDEVAALAARYVADGGNAGDLAAVLPAAGGGA